MVLLLAFIGAISQNITRAEYFVDTDPGPGNGTAIVISSPGTTVNFTTNISTASLANGFHTLVIRTADANNVWGLFETRTFYVTTNALDASALTNAEYFIDNDPGAGNGTLISIGASGNTVTFTAIIPTASLAAGFHTLAIRTRNANGTWTLFETRPFFIAAAVVDASAISGAEYFIDTDTGPGTGTPLSIGSSGNTVVFASVIPLASLLSGFHTLGIRTRNVSGTWGLYETRSFYISTATSDMPMISAAEYFIDADPGPGNGAQLTVTSPGNTINQTFMCNVPAGTANGQHFLVIRTRDANGQWSLFDVQSFNVNAGLPVHLISFTGEPAGTKITLKWITENEVNNSHFDVERSANGIDFSKIGKVNPLTGNGRKEYYFDDYQPIRGANYYRLRQVDTDGSFEYSRIIRVDMGKKYVVSISPNPAIEKITVVGSDQFKTIDIVDINGRTVRRFAPSKDNQYVVKDLAAGVYTLRLVNADRVVAVLFVKQ
jgi:hypothetical protein